MVPTCRCSGVLPEKPDFVAVVLPGTVVFCIGEMELVTTEIGTEIELVLFAEIEVELGIEVEKVVARRGAPGNELHDRNHQEIEVGGAAGEHEGGLVFDNRPLDHDVGGNEPDTTLHMVFFLVAVLHVDVDNGGKTTAVTCWESAFYKLHRLDGVAIEDRKETEEVVGIVDGGFIEDDEVLVGTATAHVDARSTFRSRLHTRQQQQGLKDILLAKKHRHLFYFLGRQRDGTHLRHLSIAFLRRNRHRLQRRDFRQFRIIFDIFRRFNPQRVVDESKAVEHDIQAVAVGQGKRVKAIRVGHGSLLRNRLVNQSAGQRLQTSTLVEVTAHGDGLSKKQGTQQQKNRCQTAPYHINCSNVMKNHFSYLKTQQKYNIKIYKRIMVTFISHTLLN